MTQSAKESLSAFKEEYSAIQRIYKDQLSGLESNSDKHREINERLTEMLSRNEEIAKLIKQRVVGISDEADRMRELVRLADLYQETLSITASNPTLFSGALQASGPGWMQNIDKLASKYKSNMSSISSELGRLLADGVHNENVLLNNLRKDMDAMERSGASYAERIQVLLSYFKDFQNTNRRVSLISKPLIKTSETLLGSFRTHPMRLIGSGIVFSPSTRSLGGRLSTGAT